MQSEFSAFLSFCDCYYCIFRLVLPMILLLIRHRGKLKLWWKVCTCIMLLFA